MTMQDDAQAAAELAPLCSEEEFAQEVAELVADSAPQLFALVEEYGERADGWVRAWGIAFDDHVEVVSVNRGLLGTFRSVERAHRAFSRHTKVRLVWHPDAPRTDDNHAA